MAQVGAPTRWAGAKPAWRRVDRRSGRHRSELEPAPRIKAAIAWGPAGAAGAARTATGRSGQPSEANHVGVSRGSTVKPPIGPRLAKLAHQLPAEDGYYFEPKWDDFRCLVFRDDQDV